MNEKRIIKAYYSGPRYVRNLKGCVSVNQKWNSILECARSRAHLLL